jgi:predicted nucleic acid-binding protein
LIVVDTSAWVEFLRGTESPADRTLARHVEEQSELAVTEVVVMEVLAGARSVQHLHDLRATLLSFPLLSLRGLVGFEAAADLYRRCRAGGETVRTLTDCLVAAAALGVGAAVLHCDADFETLARHTPLRLEPLDD